MICLTLLFLGVPLFLPNVNLVFRIVAIPSLLLFILYVLTYAIKIDDKGISFIFAFFRKEFWVSNLIEWKSIEIVKADTTARSYKLRSIFIFPKNLRASLWSNNIIRVTVFISDFENIIEHLLEHGAPFTPGLLVELGIEPHDVQTMTNIETYKVEKKEDQRRTRFFDLIIIITLAATGLLIYQGEQRGSPPLVVAGCVIFLLGMLIGFIYWVFSQTCG
jgi:hypothetical protein